MPNYGFNVIWSDEDEAYVATCPAFPDLSAFGESPEEAFEEARVVLGLFMEEYEADGVPLPEPTTLSQYSGRILLRTSKTLHAQLAHLAAREGVSQNQLIVQFLSGAVSSAAIHQESLGRRAGDVRAQVSSAATQKDWLDRAHSLSRQRKPASYAA